MNRNLLLESVPNTPHTYTVKGKINITELFKNIYLKNFLHILKNSIFLICIFMIFFFIFFYSAEVKQMGGPSYNRGRGRGGNGREEGYLGRR